MKRVEVPEDTDEKTKIKFKMSEKRKYVEN